MSDTPEANETRPTGSEPPTNDGGTTTATEEASAVERLQAEKAALEAQLKGQQRANERLRNDLKERAKVEDASSRLRVLDSSIQKLADVLKAAGDEDMAEAVDGIIRESRSASDAIDKETQAQITIGDLLGEVGKDWEDDDLETARAYYESGEYEKAIGAVRKVTETETTKTIEQRVQEELEKRLRESGQTVTNASGSKPAPAPAAPQGADAIRQKLESGDYNPLEMLQQAAALSQG